MIINPISSPSGMKPIIRVTSPIGSSVTCNGETKTVTDTSVDFIVSVSATPYTVTASKDGKTQSKSVTVDAVALFPVTLDYKLWLYDEGDECEDVTGGWVFTPSTQTSRYNAYAITRNQIEISNYTTIHAFIQSNTKRCLPQFADRNTPNNSASPFNSVYWNGTNWLPITTTGEISYSIPSTSYKYIAVGDGSNSSETSRIYNDGNGINCYWFNGGFIVTKIWLE